MPGKPREAPTCLVDEQGPKPKSCQANWLPIHLQALGESVIRKALEELQVWGLERRFTLYQYSSTAGSK